MEKKTLEELKALRREAGDKLNEHEATLRENMSKEELEKYNSTHRTLQAEYEKLSREVSMSIQDMQAASVRSAKKVDKNAELREFIKNARPNSKFEIPMNREVMGTSDTVSYVQGLTITELIPTDRKDGDILAAAGVPMTTGVTGNKIQWAYAGAVEAVFANEKAQTTERVIDLDKQNPVQQRLTVRVRITHQALENSSFDLQAYIVKVVSDAIRDKVNWAAASTTKATDTFYGGFAQDAESGTYGSTSYTPGKQTGTYSALSKDVAAEMIGKIAGRNLSLENTVFVMGAADFWAAKVTPIDQGSGIMLIGNDNRLLGIPVIANNAINRSTQKGAVSGHNIGLGSFKYMPVMQHGNIRLSIDGSSAYAADTDEVIVTINADFSMTVLKSAPDAFVVYAKTDSNI